MNNNDNNENRRAERIPLITDVEFHTLKDLIDAVSVDVSETGIKLETKEPMKIKMRFKNNGILVEKLAKIVWARTTEDKGGVYGFEFYEPEKITPAHIPDKEE